MMWFWLNVPLMVAFFGAWCGIPLVKVLRNPEWGSGTGRRDRIKATEPVPAGAVHGAQELALASAQG